MALFLVMAFGLAWLVAVPLWVTNAPLGSVAMLITGGLMMFTPSAGVVAVWWSRRRRGGFPDGVTWRRRTGVCLGFSTRRTLVLTGVAWLGVPALVALAMLLSSALGLLRLDVDGLSLARAALDDSAAELPLDLRTLVGLQLLAAVLQAPLLNAAFAFGEEWGWRGWLLPELVRRHGLWVGLVLTGIIWGAWHAPLTLRGYNYPSLGPLAAAYFIVFCTVFGVIIGWLRLATGSIWPAVIAHAALNGSVGMVTLLGDASAPPDPVVAGITGVVGIAVLSLGCLMLPWLMPLDQSPDGESPPDGWRSEQAA